MAHYTERFTVETTFCQEIGAIWEPSTHAHTGPLGWIKLRIDEDF
jgi:hypothetical protein